MNGTCAGGTGAFIDQMATLLNVPLEDLDELAKQYEKHTLSHHAAAYLQRRIFSLF